MCCFLVCAAACSFEEVKVPFFDTIPPFVVKRDVLLMKESDPCFRLNRDFGQISVEGPMILPPTLALSESFDRGGCEGK